MQTFPGHPALRAVLATDFLVLVAELGAVAILPWWITSRGGAGARVAFGITLALASFIVMPASPLSAWRPHRS